MTALVDWLRGIRSSNLVFLIVAPVIIWLVATSRSYGPALKAVLGIETNAWVLLAMFVISSLAFITGVFATLRILRTLRPDEGADAIKNDRRAAAKWFLAQSIIVAIIVALPQIDTFIVSVVVNELDPRTSEFVIVQNGDFILDAAFQIDMLTQAHDMLWGVLAFSILSLVYAMIPFAFHRSVLGRGLWYAIFILNFCSAFYVVMIAHAGFAVGLMVTLRAAVFAYLGASLLGLVWAMMSRLKPSKKASLVFNILGAILVAASLWQFTQPKDEVALIGTLDGRIGIVSGTPQGVADVIRYGEFQEQIPDSPYKIRSLASVDDALGLLEGGKISATLVPKSFAGDHPILWETQYLPVVTKTIAIVCIVFGALMLILSSIGRLIGAHPLVVFSDFFVDTIRGVPMLVIILYVGLPLSGALKAASVGYIDLEMMTRGIIAIAIGYSAYMAEIFRAGIEAVPKGQIEAARSLGMKEWHIARLIIIPQAIAIVLPALGNEFIAMLKDTSLVSILSVRDLTQRMREFQAQSFLAFEPFNSAALIYVLLTMLAASGIKSLDTMINKGKSH
jgi:polar amino acid transport system permease protein